MLVPLPFSRTSNPIGVRVATNKPFVSPYSWMNTSWPELAERMNTLSAQLVSQFGGTRLNELRVQYAKRDQSRVASDTSITGPAINTPAAEYLETWVVIELEANE